MARDSNGNYTLPAGNPVSDGTTILASWANGTMNDIATEIQDSLSRSGKGGMTGPFKAVDGSVSAPGYAFTNEPGSGWYRNGAGDIRLSRTGVDSIIVGSGSVTVPTLSVSNATVPANGLYLPSANTLGFASNTTARGSVNSTGNWVLNAPSSGTTVALSSVSAGTALSVTDGTVTGVISTTGTTFNVGGTSAHTTKLFSNGSSRIEANSFGNVTINAPSGGVALTVSSSTGPSGVVGDFYSTSDTRIALNVGATQTGVVQATSGVFNLAAIGASAVARISTNGSTCVEVAAAGNVTINAPSSGPTLTVTGATYSNWSAAVGGYNYYAVLSTIRGYVGVDGGGIIGGGTGTKFGIRAEDELLLSTAAAAYTIRYTTGGNFTIPTPASGNRGLTVNGVSGTHSTQIADSATNLYDAGYLGLPTSSSTTLALADRGKCIQATGTITVPNSTFSAGDVVCVYNNSGSAITLSASITTMRLAGTTTTGSRTIAARGFANVYFVSGTECVVAGSVS